MHQFRIPFLSSVFSNQQLHIYSPQTKFAKVMFSQVSVCPQEVSATPPWSDPPGRHPLAQCMLGYTPPLPSACWDTHSHTHPVHAGIRSTSGWYASHRNAFLSKTINAKKLLNRNCALDISFSSNTVFKSFIESIKFLHS